MQIQRPTDVILVVNPKSGAKQPKELIQGLVGAIRSAGFRCHLLDQLEAVADLSSQLFSKGQLRAVIAAGGDGTADALANRLRPEIPIQLFPVGTENLLAKHLGLQPDIAQARQILEHGNILRIDAGQANGQVFLVMASCGYDAEVVREMHAVRKGHISRWSYAGPIWRALRKYRFPQISYRLEDDFDRDSPGAASAASQVQSDKRESELSEQAAPITKTAAWIFVFNVPRYAAALDFCPQADPQDGLLDVCTFRRSGILPGLNYLGRLVRGSHQSLPSFEHRQCTRLRIESVESRQSEQSPEIPFQLDGDPGGKLPVDIQLLPKRLAVLVP